MIKHVVMFKFKEGLDQAVIDVICEDLAALPDTIDTLREFLFGLDVVRSPRSFDFAIVASFDDVEGLGVYHVHPAHQAVALKLREACTAVNAVDFEL